MNKYLVFVLCDVMLICDIVTFIFVLHSFSFILYFSQVTFLKQLCVVEGMGVLCDYFYTVTLHYIAVAS